MSCSTIAVIAQTGLLSSNKTSAPTIRTDSVFQKGKTNLQDIGLVSYHFKGEKEVWTAQDYNDENWPKSYMISMGVKKSAVI